jgi:Zn-dependent protease/CBS domain-containing protein
MTSSPVPPQRTGVKLGAVLGVPVYLAPSWFLFAAFIVLISAGPLVGQVGGARAYAAGISFAVLLGVSVLLHEIGHCVVARAFGLPVRSITITLLAGFTEITKPPQTPAREYSVAVAGPMVSLLLAGVGVALVPAFEPHTLPRVIVEGIALTNGLVAAFNLLPGLPLDGGRVLRSIVWRLSGDELRATRASAWAGRIVAVVVVPLLLVVVLPATGYSSNGPGNIIFAALVAGFIYTGATASLRRAQAETRLPRVTVAALARPSLQVTADTPLSEAVRRAQEANAYGLIVVDSSGRLEGVVSEAAVIATPEQRRPWVPVGTLARRLEPGLLLDARLSGEELLTAMQATPASEYVAQDAATGETRVLVADDVARALSA